MTQYALDASALLALLYGEPGADRVDDIYARAAISAVNLCEVESKIVERGGDLARVFGDMPIEPMKVIAFDRDQAEAAALLRAPTRKLGLSLGDRCCLALAQRDDLTVLTTDQAWATLDIGVEIELIR